MLSHILSETSAETKMNEYRHGGLNAQMNMIAQVLATCSQMQFVLSLCTAPLIKSTIEKLMEIKKCTQNMTMNKGGNGFL